LAFRLISDELHFGPFSIGFMAIFSFAFFLSLPHGGCVSFMNLLRHKADTGPSGHKAENIRLQLLRVFVAYIPGHSKVI